MQHLTEFADTLNFILLICNENWIPGQWVILLLSRVSRWRSKLGGEVESELWQQVRVKFVQWPCNGSEVSPPLSFLCLYMAGTRVPENCPDCPSLLFLVHSVVFLLLVFISWLNDNSGSTSSGQSPSICTESADLALSQSSLFRLERQCERWWILLMKLLATSSHSHPSAAHVLLWLFKGCYISDSSVMSSGAREVSVRGISAETELSVLLWEGPRTFTTGQMIP